MSNAASDEHVRLDLEKQIARRAKIACENVTIDFPTLPSVPYHDTAGLHSMDIPVFKHAPNGGKEIVPLTQVSRIAGVLQTFMNLVRVYTKQSYRDRVESAARQILGESPT